MEKWEKIPVEVPKNVQHITPMSTRRSYLWGLYTKTDSQLYMLTNGAMYKLTDTPKSGKKIK